MATKQRIVFGSTTKWGTDGSTWADIPECKGIAVPTIEVDYQDATHLQSPGGFREYVPGLKDQGSITLPCGYSSAGYAQAHGYMMAGTLVHFQTTLPKETGQATGDVFEFTGYVAPQLESNEVGDIIAMNLVVRTTGQPTFTEGTAA
ncbi:phage tail protein [Chachezhania sediminis]|uniref:phage tail tube protein n=1 Tax=Chachezhania sediminis TaxID=2599291 RepID=UPI00131DCDE0|nr:phage tail tube protein [Chachezhania sediminis]